VPLRLTGTSACPHSSPIQPSLAHACSHTHTQAHTNAHTNEHTRTHTNGHTCAHTNEHTHKTNTNTNSTQTIVQAPQAGAGCQPTSCRVQHSCRAQGKHSPCALVPCMHGAASPSVPGPACFLGRHLECCDRPRSVRPTRLRPALRPQPWLCQTGGRWSPARRAQKAPCARSRSRRAHALHSRSQSRRAYAHHTRSGSCRVHAHHASRPAC